MPPTTVPGSRVDVKLWAPPHEVEAPALEQLRNISSLPWVFHHVAAMPDVHLGVGATIGSVVAMRDAIAPSAVGVDLACGMSAVRTSLGAADLPDDLGRLRSAVERAIPVGFAAHKRPLRVAEEWGLWTQFRRLDPAVQGRFEKAMTQLGTLGGGNHFIELCLDTNDHVWLMLHSGSRNIGKELADVHISRAKKLPHNQDLPDRDLAVFLADTPEMEAYRHDLFWAQHYAALNRSLMIDLYKDVLRRHFPDVAFDEEVSCHHNYVAEEEHYGQRVLVTRKGAIRAGRGDLGIIPGSMGGTSYIVRGLGNAEWFESAPHGAGRRMSRNGAKKRYTVDDLRRLT